MGKYVLMLCLAAMLVTGCSSKVQQPMGESGAGAPFPAIIEPHNAEQAEESGDVVIQLGEIRNRDKWKSFMKNVKRNQPDQVRVTTYTIEGGPIIHGLVYDGKIIQTTYDNSRDMYGSGEVETTNTCTGIGTMKDKPWRTFYILTGCEKENIFSIPSR